ncbi:MAG: dTDP-4-dehydrorhamnose reductase [Bacillota bacterium]
MGKVMVTGSRGMLGRAVVAAFSAAGFDVVALDHGALDVTDLSAVRKVTTELRPGLVVNCAAYTDVDRAESESALAMSVNALGARNVALACLDAGAQLVHISTDYVFSGNKGEPYSIWDPCDPINTYGRSKAWGEYYVRSLLPRSYIIRTSWLFGPGGDNFVATMLRLARDGETIQVVEDEQGCPTFTEDLAGAMVDLVRTRAFGTYHITNSGSVTRYGLASLAVALAGLPVRIQPVASGEFPRRAARPRNSALDAFPLRETIGHLLPDWQDAVRRYVIGLTSTGVAQS